MLEPKTSRCQPKNLPNKQLDMNRYRLLDTPNSNAHIKTFQKTLEALIIYRSSLCF